MLTIEKIAEKTIDFRLFCKEPQTNRFFLSNHSLSVTILSVKTHRFINTRAVKSGFSLTEMLVVVAIIFILLAIAILAIRSSREKAASAVCAQNLRQIGVGLHSFISENNGRFPDGSADVSWLGRGLCWYDAAAQYMGRPYVTPIDRLPKQFGCPAGHGKAHEPNWPYTGDYAANSSLGTKGYRAETLASVRNPVSTPYVQDTVNQNQFGYWAFDSGMSKSQIAAFADRHGGRGNILWVDGHVSSFRYAEYISYANKSHHGGIYNFSIGDW